MAPSFLAQKNETDMRALRCTNIFASTPFRVVRTRFLISLCMPCSFHWAKARSILVHRAATRTRPIRVQTSHRMAHLTNWPYSLHRKSPATLIFLSLIIFPYEWPVSIIANSMQIFKLQMRVNSSAAFNWPRRSYFSRLLSNYLNLTSPTNHISERSRVVHNYSFASSSDSIRWTPLHCRTNIL